MEVEFSRLNLKEGDSLIIKIKGDNLSEDELKYKVFETREDEFVKFVESKGHKVFVAHPGIDFSVLRMDENDKLVAYVDISPFTNDEANSYIDFLNFKLEPHFEEQKLVVVPTRKNTVQLGVKINEEKE